MNLPPLPVELMKLALGRVERVVSVYFLWKVKFDDATFYVVAIDVLQAVSIAQGLLKARWKTESGTPNIKVKSCVCMFGVDGFCCLHD